MTVQQLKYVLAVYQAGSISKAAQVLYVAQPNLSAAIKKLEAEIRANSHKLMTPQARKAAIAAGRAVDVSADDFD